MCSVCDFDRTNSWCHTIQLHNYSLPTWFLLAHIPRTVTFLERSDIILTLATCCYWIRDVVRSDGNFLTYHSTQALRGGGGKGAIMSPNDLSFLRAFPFFLPPSIHSFPSSFTYNYSSVSPFHSFLCLLIRFFLFLFLLSRLPFSLSVPEPYLVFYSLVLSTFPWLGFSLVWHRVLVMLSQLYRLHCTDRFLPRSFTFYNAISVACITYSRRFRWPSGLWWGSAAARLLGLRVRIPPGVWTTVSWECYQVQVSGTSQSLVQRRHSNRGVSLCDVGTSSTRGSWPALGCCARKEYIS